MTEKPKLAIVFGDQLSLDSAALDAIDPDRDAVLMMEVAEEATYIPAHKKKLVLFFSAMRHFAEKLRTAGFDLRYVELDDPDNCGTFEGEIVRIARKLDVGRLVCALPGDHRVKCKVEKAAGELGVPVDILPDRHFLSTVPDFQDFAHGRKTLVMEHFYRRMRRSLGILMEDGEPAGGQWNFDADNRRPAKEIDSNSIPPLLAFPPDSTTKNVMAMVDREFAGHPGDVEKFDYPVTAADARIALRDFVDHRLAHFGDYQDAMLAGEPFLYHACLSSALNLHLLDPRDCIAAAVDAYEQGNAPLNAVEGFVRQIAGWREFVRGVYWSNMPGYADFNEFSADLPVPDSYWTGETDMTCLRESMKSLKAYGYAHHIQRLMVFGLYAMLLGVHPYRLHEWHMAMYVDAIDWASLPNVLGMSQHADGELVGTKPYAASGAYIDRMSDYCASCRYDPKSAVGGDACPMTTLYWDFLDRHQERLKSNRRMTFQLRNLEKKSTEELSSIRTRAEKIRQRGTA